MPTLCVNKEALDALRAMGTTDFTDDSVRVGDNRYIIPVEPEVIDTLEARRMIGETNSDVILRVCAQAKGQIQ